MRAAYSDRSAALMATLAQLAYIFPPAGGTPGPASAPIEVAELGFDKITYFHNGLKDGWAFLAEGPDIIALAFRGTASIRNWETDFQVRMLWPPNTDNSLRVHEGFYRAFSLLSDGEKGIRAKLQEVETATSGRIPIYLTGHSLGGALAQIAAAVYGSDQIAACYTFGSPRVGNAYFDLWVKPPSYRVMNYADIVPQIPWFAAAFPLPIFYRHSGDPRYLAPHNAGSPYRYQPGWPTRIAQLFAGVVQLIRSRQILGIKDHGMTEYETKLAAIAAARTQSR
jgi:hypothetical protein